MEDFCGNSRVQFWFGPHAPYSCMEDYLQKGDVQSYTSVDERLHNHIVHLGDNSLVNDTYDRVRSMNQQFRILSLMDPQRFRESLDEHREIVHAGKRRIGFAHSKAPCG